MIVFSTMIVFIHAEFKGNLTTDIVKDAFVFVAGAIFGRGRPPEPDKPETKLNG
jgi:predicted acyltransferase